MSVIQQENPDIFGMGFFACDIFLNSHAYNIIPSNLLAQTIGNTIVQLFTPNNLYVDSINIQASDPNPIDMQINVEKRGGLKDFTLTLPRDINIRFFNQMLVKFFIGQNLWFSGILDYNAIPDSSSLTIKLQGTGYVKQLEKQIINVTYSNKTIAYIINDIFLNQIAGKTDIFYSVAYINAPATVIATYEANNKDVKTVLEELTDIANVSFSTTEYTYFIDKNLYINFLPVTKTNSMHTFFEGYDYQLPDVQNKTDKLINKVDIYRTLSSSSTTQYVSTVSDSDSIANYGERKYKLTLSTYMDQTTGENIANYLISRWGSPKKTIKIKKLIPELYPFDIGLYTITNKQNNYINVIDECNKLANWNITHPNSTVSLETTIINSGRASFKWIAVSPSNNSDFIEYVFAIPCYFIEQINIYINDYSGVGSFRMEAENTAGHVFTLGVVIGSLLSDVNNVLITTVNGDPIYTITYSPVSFPILNVFQLCQFANLNLKNIKKIRLYNMGAGTTCYIDRLEVQSRIFSSSSLTLERISYNTVSSMILADCEFGELEQNAVDKIAEIQDNQASLFQIFTKQ